MINETAAPPGIAELILVRLLVAGAKPKAADYRRQLSVFLHEPMSAAEWNTHVQQLAAAGLLNAKPLALTDAGRVRALEFLGETSLPPRTNWNSLVANLLVPVALGLSTSDSRVREQIKTADELSALVV